MTLTISNITGDGLSVPQIRFSVEQPDTYPDSIAFEGSLVPVPPPGGTTTPITFTGSPLGPINPPGSGSMYYNVQVDPGAGPNFPATVPATLQNSPTGDPAPVSATAIVVYRFVVPTGSVDPALITSNSTPDLWLPRPHVRVSEAGELENIEGVVPGEHMVISSASPIPGEDDPEDAPSRAAFQASLDAAAGGVAKAAAQAARLSQASHNS